MSQGIGLRYCLENDHERFGPYDVKITISPTLNADWVEESREKPRKTRVKKFDTLFRYMEVAEMESALVYFKDAVPTEVGEIVKAYSWSHPNCRISNIVVVLGTPADFDKFNAYFQGFWHI